MRLNRAVQSLLLQYYRDDIRDLNVTVFERVPTCVSRRPKRGGMGRVWLNPLWHNALQNRVSFAGRDMKSPLLILVLILEAGHYIRIR